MKKFVFAWLLVTFLLLASVIVGNFVFSFFKKSATVAEAVPVYAVNEMLIGIGSESLRAFLTCHLYPQLKNYGSSLGHAVWFGLVVSGLIGSLWLVVGYGSFEMKNPDAFFWSDALILLLQGVLSGFGLFFGLKK